MSWTTVLTTTAVLALLAGCFSCALPSDQLADARKIEAEATAFDRWERRMYRICADTLCGPLGGNEWTRWSNDYKATSVECYCGDRRAATFWRAP